MSPRHVTGNKQENKDGFLTCFRHRKEFGSYLKEWFSVPKTFCHIKVERSYRCRSRSSLCYNVPRYLPAELVKRRSDVCLRECNRLTHNHTRIGLLVVNYLMVSTLNCLSRRGVPYRFGRTSNIMYAGET